jgi:hypothetical protein
MIQELLRLPDLRIRLVEPRDAQGETIESNSRKLVLDADNGFIPYQLPRVPASLVLQTVSPSRALVGTAFNVQPNRRSALAITTSNAGSGTVVMLAGKALETAYGNPRFLTALVPDSVLRNPGTYPIYLRDGGRESNRIEFVVEPASIEAERARRR